MTGFVLGHQMAIVAVAVLAGIAGVAVYVLDVRRAERRKEGRAADQGARAFEAAFAAHVAGIRETDDQLDQLDWVAEVLSSEDGEPAGQLPPRPQLRRPDEPYVAPLPDPLGPVDRRFDPCGAPPLAWRQP
jgi:hypothetical protein